MTSTEPAVTPEVKICKRCNVRPVEDPAGAFGRNTHCAQCLEERRAEGRSGKTDSDAAPSGKGRRRRSSSSTERPTAPRSQTSRASLAPRLQNMIGMVGIAVFTVNPDDGRAVMNGAPQLAQALDDLARENPRVRKVLEGLLATSAWSGVAVATANIAVPILANHGMLPPAAAPFFGGSEPTPAPEPQTTPADVPPDLAGYDGASSAPGGTGAFVSG